MKRENLLERSIGIGLRVWATLCRVAVVGVWYASFPACARRPPENIQLEVGAVVDAQATGPARIAIERGAIVRVTTADTESKAVATPGRFSLWKAEGLPTPVQLTDLLAQGYTSVVLADRPLVDSIALREYVGTARNRGPRVFVSGPQLSGELHAHSGERDARMKVREFAATGVDFVMVDATAGERIVCAVSEEARRQKVWVWLRGEGKTLLAQQRSCKAQVVWMTGSTPLAPGQETSGVWISDNWEEPPSPPTRAAQFNLAIDAEAWSGAVSRGTQGAARTLNLGDAIGRVATNYRADLVVLDGARRRIFVDGVEQSPRVPWFADFMLWLTRSRIRDPGR